MRARFAAVAVGCGVVTAAFGALDQASDPSWWNFVRIIVGGLAVTFGVRLAIDTAVQQARKERRRERVQ